MRYLKWPCMTTKKLNTDDFVAGETVEASCSHAFKVVLLGALGLVKNSACLFFCK